MESRFRIVIPARAALGSSAPTSKRKSTQPNEDNEVIETGPKHKHKKVKKGRGISRSADSSDDEGESNTRVAPKKQAPKKPGPGRPRKETRTSFVVPCYIEIPQPPRVVPGRTVKGDKSYKQAPKTVGPIDLTSKTAWEPFVRAIMMEAELGKDKIKAMCAGMKWGLKKAGTLPLNDPRGYLTMLQQISARKDVDSLMVFVTLPPSCTPSKGHREHDKENTNSDEGGHARPGRDDTMYGQKVSYRVRSPSYWDSHRLTALS